MDPLISSTSYNRRVIIHGMEKPKLELSSISVWPTTSYIPLWWYLWNPKFRN